MRKDLKNWITERGINLKKIGVDLFEIDEVGKFLLVYPKDIEVTTFSGGEEKPETISAILDRETFGLILSDEEQEIFEEQKCNFYLFSFGGLFYYSERAEDIDFIQFKYLGKAKRKINERFCNLGVHGGYEILNGTRVYSDWVEKTKFLGLTSLGICEKNTLAGILEFQIKCLDKDITPVLGETVTVKNAEGLYDVKLYLKNSEGWKSLLKINKQINTVNEMQFIMEDELMKFSEGIVCVLSTLTPLSRKLVTKYKTHFKEVFFQIDSVEYTVDEADKVLLQAFKIYFTNYLKLLSPVLLNDCYYLEKSDSKIKKMVNNFRSSGTFEYLSDNQFYKDLSHSFSSLSEIFSEEKQFEGKDFFDLFELMIENTLLIEQLCQYTIDTKGFKLPKFEFTDLDQEYQKFVETEDEDGLFWYLIDKGVKKKLSHISEEQLPEYLERIQIEYKVINKGGFIGYFLVLWDIIEFCNKNDILTGLGRGCFTPDCKVLLSDGSEKFINQIQVGDLVKNFFNEESKIKKVFEYDIIEEIIELTLENGTIIKCTKDHKIHTLNRGWVEADQLTEIDEINLISQ